MSGPAVVSAISACTAILCRAGIAKTQKNVHQKYNFRGIDDILNALAPALVESGLVLLPAVESRQETEKKSKDGGALNHVVLRVRYDVISVADGSSLTVVVYGEAMDTSDKATNKALSAAYKYAAIQIFCIPVQGLEDADADSPELDPPPPLPPPSSPQNEADEAWIAKMDAAEKALGRQTFFAELGACGYSSIDEVPVHGRNFVRNKMLARFQDQKKNSV